MNATEKRIILPFFRKVSACSVRALSLEALSLLRRYGEKRRKPSLRKAEKEEKKLGKKGARADVRAACVERAKGICECGCGLPFGTGEATAEWDEFYGRRHVSLEETWMLRRDHHRMKTENQPARSLWDAKFRAHSFMLGYPPPRLRLTKQLTGSKA